MSLNKLSAHRVYGLVLGLVTSHADPRSLGRVKVRYHMFDQSVESDWCRVIALYAGPDRGTLWLPEEGDEVALAFEHGDVNFPFVVGSVWNGKAAPPTKDQTGALKSQNPGGGNDLKRIRSRSGHEITFDDTKGQEKLTVLDASARNKLEIDVSTGRITLESAQGDIYLNAPQGTVRVRCQTFDVKATGELSLAADASLTATAKGALRVTSQSTGTLKVSGALSLKSDGGPVAVEAGGALTASGSTLGLKAAGAGELKAGGDLVVKGLKVFIN